MTASRRAFLASAGALASTGLFLSADEDSSKAKKGGGKPPSSLIFETIFTEGLAHLSYLIGDKETGKAAVIDPRRDVEVYLELARKHKLSIRHALETHIHADFVSGCRELAAAAGGGCTIGVSAEGDAKYGFKHRGLKDGDRIDLGRVILTARHTPGHTPEHLSYVVAERQRPETPFAVFSGDCLFAESVGRPDLLGEEQSEKLAKQLFAVLRKVYLAMPDEVRVHPAHAAGSPCGANISDRKVTTIGYERRFNPALQIDDEGKFVEYVLRTAPPEPTYYRRLKKLNARGPEVLGGLPAAVAVTPEEFARAVDKDKVHLIDNRQMLAFGGGHIAGALNIGPRAELSIWAGWLLDPERPIWLVLERDEELQEVSRQLIRVGCTRIAGYLMGGMEAWLNAGRSVETMPQMTVHELNKALPPRDLQVLDVRTPDEWQSGHVPGASYLFLPELAEKASKLDKDRPVAVYCDSGYRASIGASQLRQLGFKKVRNVPGSWKAWTAADYPAEKPQKRKKSSDTDLS